MSRYFSSSFRAGFRSRVLEMKLGAGTALLLLQFAGAAVGQKAAPVTYAIKGPTVIAFFRHVTDVEMEKDPDTNEALSDFQLYAAQAALKLKLAGIAFEVASTKAFRVKDGLALHTFKGKIDVGYYFVAPGKEPRVAYGVHDDQEIVEIAAEYFRTSARKP